MSSSNFYGRRPGLIRRNSFATIPPIVNEKHCELLKDCSWPCRLEAPSPHHEHVDERNLLNAESTKLEM